MNLPVEVWSAIIGLMGGIVGVSIGALLQRILERKHWERTLRLEAYDSFLTALDAFALALQRDPVNLDDAFRAKREAHLRLTRLILVGSENTINSGRSALLHLTMLDAAARMVALQGVPVNYSLDEFSEAYEYRRSFVKASRQDVKVKPTEIPSPSILPATPESQDE